MSVEQAAEVILAGERWVQCPEGCDHGRIEVHDFEGLQLGVGDAMFSISNDPSVPSKKSVRCKRCNGSGQVTPQVYADASAQLGMLVPQYPEPQSYTLTAWIFPPGTVKLD